MNKTDFTKGSITKAFLMFFFPMLLANILQQIYSFADMVIIGKGLGDNSVAAVGNFTTLSFFLTGFIMGVTNGFSVNISHWNDTVLLFRPAGKANAYRTDRG